MNKLYGMHRIQHEEDCSGLNKDFTVVVNQINRIFLGLIITGWSGFSSKSDLNKIGIEIFM